MSIRVVIFVAMFALIGGYFAMIPDGLHGGWLCLCASAWLSGYLTGGGATSRAKL